MSDIQTFDHHVPERRRNDELILTLIQQMTDSHKELSEKVGDLSDRMIRFDVTMATQVQTIEKYNNFGNRILTLEQTQKNCMERCASIQQQKKDDKKTEEEDKKRFKVPWGTIVSGVIIGIIVGLIMLIPELIGK